MSQIVNISFSLVCNAKLPLMNNTDTSSNQAHLFSNSKISVLCLTQKLSFYPNILYMFLF